MARADPAAEVADLVRPELLNVEGRSADWYAWREQLPSLVARIVAEWDLRPESVLGVGECSLVLGVTVDDRPAAAKFGWPHPEARYEHLALRAWAGGGAIRLLRADPVRSVLLLERTSTTDLTTVPVERACTVVAEMYRRLHRTALPQLDLLSSAAERWARELRALPSSAPLPHRLVDQAAGLAADFATDRHTDGHLLHTDLHYMNVLAAQREPWLVIDPKPMSGDPCYEVAPLLWNRWDEIPADEARAEVRRRMDIVVSVADLDPDRVRDWVIVRELVNAMDTVTSAAQLGPGDHEWVTRCVTIAKAVQD